MFDAFRQVDAWLAAVDEDRSGVIELNEFCRLMRAMRRAIQSDSGGSALGSALGGVRSAAHTVQAAARVS